MSADIHNISLLQVEFKILRADGNDLQKGGVTWAQLTGGGWWAVAGATHSLLLEVPPTA